MTQLIATDAIVGQLQGLTEVTEIRTSAGHLLGYFHPAGKPLRHRVHSPVSDEEMERRIRERVPGPPLDEFLDELEKRA